MVDKENNWDITEEIRKEMYKIMLKIDTKYTKSQYSKQDDIFVIKEFTRKDESLTTHDLEINTKEVDDISLNTTDERFSRYLSLFKCSIDDVKDLPYYLIPCLISLRYLICKKIKTNSFIFNKNDSLYSHLVKYLPNLPNNEINNSVETNEKDEINIFTTDDDDDNNDNDDDNNNNDDDNIDDDVGVKDSKELNKNDIDKASKDSNKIVLPTVLHYYEFEALLASCIAALTFTYLHTNSYSVLKEKTADPEHSITSKYSIETNIKENDIGCHNLYDNLRYNQTRSLQLKKRWTIDQMENTDQYENAIQIFSEYVNILNTNTNAMQSLKLSIDFPEFKSFTSMYHYQWEESFHCMVNPIKNSEERNISLIFNDLFKVNHFNNNVNNVEYINYLSNLYTKMLNTIVLNIE